SVKNLHRRLLMRRFASVYYMATVLGMMTLIGVGWPTRAADAQTVWSSVAAGCVLDSASASRASTNASFGTVTFKGSATGRIHLSCPVTVPVNSAMGGLDLGVNYYDPDGPGTTCQVRAFLLRTNLDELERGNTIVGFDSNTGYSRTEAATGRSVGYSQI